ncbi:hypothetical protein [Elstera litoralis]|uniref:hypothetical protein n=1 Tax=Elstera litoralis TaxID=552518 RepID=UPI0012EEC359|nr:hypothetical protein [Elstera litoralis]
MSIDYKALAAAITEELSKKDTSSSSASTDDLSSKPVSRDEIDYVIDDKGYDFRKQIGEDMKTLYSSIPNFPVCYITNRRGGIVFGYDFDNRSISSATSRNCLFAVARWAVEKKITIPFDKIEKLFARSFVPLPTELIPKQ